VNKQRLCKNYMVFLVSAFLFMSPFSSLPLHSQEHQIEKATIYQDIYPLISEADRYCSFFIWNGDMPEIQITGAEREYEREMLSNGDVVYINQGSKHGLESGQVFMILQVGHDRGYRETMAQDTVSGFGMLAYRRGRLRLKALGEEQSTAEIEKACGKIMVGDSLVPFQPMETVMGKDLGYDIPPFEAEGTKGKIIFLETEFNQIGNGHWALINVGQQDGVERGDQLVIYRKVEEGAPLKVIGNSVVIDAQEETATIKILSCRDPVELNDQIMRHPEK
jgi:hypothetical protein